MLGMMDEYIPIPFLLVSMSKQLGKSLYRTIEFNLIYSLLND
jgi:hypothetical protein